MYFMVKVWKELQWSGHNHHGHLPGDAAPKKSDVLHSGQLFSNLVFHIPSEDFFYLKRYISLLLFTFNLVY